MTNATMALAELAEKGADVDVLRQTVQQVTDLVQGRVPKGALNAASASRLQAFFDRP